MKRRKYKKKKKMMRKHVMYESNVRIRIYNCTVTSQHLKKKTINKIKSNTYFTPKNLSLLRMFHRKNNYL